MSFAFLDPPVRVCVFKTDTANLLSGEISPRPNYFPRKEVPVGWLLFSKCTVAIIQYFEHIIFVCCGRKWNYSLLHKNHNDLEFTTDS